MILNKTRNHRDRYRIQRGSMGGYGDHEDSPNHRWEIVNGIDQGHGYQGYLSVKYALETRPELHDAIMAFLETHDRAGYDYLKKPIAPN